MPRPKRVLGQPVTTVRWEIPTCVLDRIRDRAHRAGHSLIDQVRRDMFMVYGFPELVPKDEPLPIMQGGDYTAAPATASLSTPKPAAAKPVPQQSWADAYKRRLEQQAAAPASTTPDAGLPSEVPDEPLSTELQALLDRPPPSPFDPYAGLTYDQLPPDAPAEVKARVMRAQIERDPANPLSHADPDDKLYQARAKQNVREWHERHGKMLPERTSFGDATISDDHIRPDWQRPPPGTVVHPAR